ncbi:hypothetical protein N8946_04065 [Pseudomonadales bacterium]|nr:hypothetical protein [Pseudomonadales bacterium]
MMNKKKLRNVRICGIGCVPERVVPNKELAELVDTNAEWIHNTLGIKERRRADASQRTSDLGSIAALRAIGYAGIDDN